MFKKKKGFKTDFDIFLVQSSALNYFEKFRSY